jgi:NADH-quinone oxidoreductase subunit L
MNYQTAALILLLTPLLSALVILLLHKTLRAGAVIVSLGSAAICLATSLLLLFKPSAVAETEGLLLPFLRLPGLAADLDYILDSQAIGMMFIVSFIGFLVHLYSVGYMKDDDAKPRFFGALSLFMFSMTGIVLAGNLIMMFVFWELVGVSSYLLIGHWFKKPEAADAAKKAFLTNRIGDFGFMIGILCLWAVGGMGSMVGNDKEHTTRDATSTLVVESGADYTPDLSFSGLERQFESREDGRSPALPEWLLTLAATARLAA